MEGAEAHLAEDEGEVVRRRVWRDVSGQANLSKVSWHETVKGMPYWCPYEVERPQVVVLDALPETLKVDALPVVHVAL